LKHKFSAAYLRKKLRLEFLSNAILSAVVIPITYLAITHQRKDYLSNV